MYPFPEVVSFLALCIVFMQSSHESPEKEVLVNEWRLFGSIKCTCLTFKMWASIYLKLVVLGKYFSDLTNIFIVLCLAVKRNYLMIISALKLLPSLLKS